MNCKLEKFWNRLLGIKRKSTWKWTVNLKSFEIATLDSYKEAGIEWTVNLKSFEIL